LQDIEYLDKLRKITGTLEALPLYYTKALLDIEIDNVKSVITEFKKIVSDHYINTIMEKRRKNNE